MIAALAVVLVAAPMHGSRVDIDAALDAAYPKVLDLRFGLQAQPGEDSPPLAEVVAYRLAKPVPHWFYVTYGLSEIEGKTSPDPKLSGFGVELTLRLVDDAKEPPKWPIQFLRALADRMWETRNAFDPRHSANLPAGMLDAVSKGVDAVAFYEDEELKPLATPTGKLTFVQVVPLMAGELALHASWDALKFAAELKTAQGDLMWRSARKSLLAGPRAAEIKAQAAKDGSSQALEFADVACGKKGLVLDATGALLFDRMLRYRAAYGRETEVQSKDAVLKLKPGKAFKLTVGKPCVIEVPQGEAVALAEALAAAKKGATVTRAGGLSFQLNR